MMEVVKVQVKQLKQMNKADFVKQLCEFTDSLDLKYGTSQMKSWDNCIEYLLTEFNQTSKYDDAFLLFEYCLPFTNYRRPDVIMLFKDKVIVLEFKRKDVGLLQDVEQLTGYLNYIRNYHDQTQKMKLLVEGALVLTVNKKDEYILQNGYTLIQGFKLVEFLERVANQMSLEQLEVNVWVNSSYYPSKNVLKATYQLFMKDDLSMIKNISEEELQNTLSVLAQLTKQTHQKKRLIFLTGVPGAGKTLALLHTLYKLNKEHFKAVFLTGNGPLEKVLSYLLSNQNIGANGEALIKGILAYKKMYFNRNVSKPNEHYMIPPTVLFDEAQRAWNEKQMGSYGMSEPELMLQVQAQAAQQHGFTNIVASIGFGQSIYKGEEDEFDTWVKVVEKHVYKDWEIYAPEMLRGKLGHLSNVKFIDGLHLDTSIRSNFIDTSKFIEAVINADVDKAKKEYESLKQKGYYIKLVNDINSARLELERNETVIGDSFYGLLASSNSNYQMMKQDVGHSKMIRQTDSKETLGQWFFTDCSKLDAIASEFVCQGLELNHSIVYFGRDFVMRNGKWVVQPSLTKGYDDPEQTVRNIYRVLLSRGRIGMYLLVKDMETNSFFEKVLADDLSNLYAEVRF